jgi:hypothetical protein
MKRIYLELVEKKLVARNLNDKNDVFVCNFLTEIMEFVKGVEYVLYSDNILAIMKMKRKFTTVEQCVVKRIDLFNELLDNQSFKWKRVAVKENV